MGATLVILVGLPVSLITRTEADEITDERFITPFLRRNTKEDSDKKDYRAVSQIDLEMNKRCSIGEKGNVE